MAETVTCRACGTLNRLGPATCDHCGALLAGSLPPETRFSAQRALKGLWTFRALWGFGLIGVSVAFRNTHSRWGDGFSALVLFAGLTTMSPALPRWPRHQAWNWLMMAAAGLMFGLGFTFGFHGPIGVWGWILFVAIAGAFLVPFAMLARRLGRSAA